MFVKFTRLDNTPIWLNASFVVTVEPRRAGGSIVVPIGDGLDYDVRETPEQVLAMLAGAPTPAVVPIPVSDCLTKTPTDVSPGGTDPLPKSKEVPVVKPADPKPAEPEPAPEEKVEAPKTTRKRKTTKSKTAAANAEAAASEATPVEATAEAPVVVPAEVPVEMPAEPPVEKPVKKRATRKRKPPMPLDEDQLIRLRKMVPGSIKKLKNTLTTQFKVSEADSDSVIAALEAHEVIAIDGVRISWSV